MILNPEELENLSNLLLSVDDNNTRLAFEIMDTATAEELLTEIFVVYKLSEAPDLKEKAYQFLASQKKVDIQPMVNCQVLLGPRGLVVPTEKTILKNIGCYVELSKQQLNGEKMALALYNKYAVGLGYLLKNLSEPLKSTLLKSFISGTSFKLNACSLSKIPDELYQFTELTEIDLSQNKIKTIPAKIAVFQNLESLNVAENQISKLNKALEKLPKLKDLNISMNKFKEFPPVLAKLKQLEVLEMRTLHYTMLGETYRVPSDFTKLKQLKKIVLAENHGSYLGYNVHLALQDFPNFTTIEAPKGAVLNLNPLAFAEYVYQQNGRSEGVYYIFQHSSDTALIKDIIETKYYDANSKTLDFKNSTLPHLPKEMGDYEIEHLNFDGSSLGILLYDVGLYQRYHQVPLKSPEQLKALFDLFAQNKNMQSVSLTYNRLCSVPATLFEWKKLKDLNLRNNKLKSLPDQMEAFQELEYLDLYHNELTELPDSFKTLQNLKVLNIGENPFEEIPAQIGYLSNLEELHYRNPLPFLDPKTAKENVPTSFAGLKNLKKMNFYVDGMYYNKENCKAAYRACLEDLLPKGCEIVFD